MNRRGFLAMLGAGAAITLLAQGCAQIPAERANWPPAACVGDVHSYRLTPDGYKWYLDCVNQT
jgi:hypothetical protein